VRDGRLEHVEPLASAMPAHDRLPWIAPGLIDIQINGYGGQEFSSLELTPEKVADIVRCQYRFGVTRLCPTLTTQSDEVLLHGVRTIALACRQFADANASIVGIHVEGPFISPEDGPRGAHPPEHCRAPDWQFFARLQQAAGERIRLLTLSPEYAQAPDFIRRATHSGVVIAIGHTAATGDQIRSAVDAGARLSTHLGNGAHRMLRRHPNYLWDQLAEDRLQASLIVDGHHLPAEVVQTFVRAKTPERIILVSDLSGLAALPVGRYFSSGCELEILPDGRLVIAGQDQLLAGASLPLITGIGNVIRFAGVDLTTAVRMATLHPARLLGLTNGTLEPGELANFVLFERDPADALRVLATVHRGEVVFGHLSAD
jgi:N-acetylglucosamine-6-phosphate deacetylase